MLIFATILITNARIFKNLLFKCSLLENLIFKSLLKSFFWMIVFGGNIFIIPLFLKLYFRILIFEWTVFFYEEAFYIVHSFAQSYFWILVVCQILRTSKMLLWQRGPLIFHGIIYATKSTQLPTQQTVEQHDTCLACISNMLLGTLCRERLQKWLHLMNKHLQSLSVPQNDYRNVEPPPVKDIRWMTYASCFVRCVPLHCNSLVLLGVSSFQGYRPRTSLFCVQYCEHVFPYLDFDNKMVMVMLIFQN